MYKRSHCGIFYALRTRDIGAARAGAVQEGQGFGGLSMPSVPVQRVRTEAAMDISHPSNQLIVQKAEFRQ